MEPIQNQSSANKGIITGIIALLVVGGGIFAYLKKSNTDTQPIDNTVTIPTDNPVTTPGVVVSMKYKDGTYSATGNYQSPGGAESVNLTLVLKDDVVTDATVTANGTRGESIQYQNKFIGGFKQYVVGKKISDINVTKVSGSSLTPKGFMDALAQIKIKATV